MRIRNWSIRAKIFTLLVPSLASLIAFWVFATTLTLGPALNLLSTRTTYEQAGKPAEAMVTELQRERMLSLAYLGVGRTDARALAAQRPRTDAAVAQFRRRAASQDLTDVVTEETRQRLEDAVGALDTLATGRDAVDLGQVDRPTTLGLYNSIVDSVYRVLGSLPGIEDRAISADARTLITLSRARELLSQEDAFVSGVAAAGRLTGAEHGLLVQLMGSQRFLFSATIPELPTAAREAYQTMFKGDVAVRLRGLEDRIVAEVRPNVALPIDISTWRSTHDELANQLRGAELSAGQAIIDRGIPLGGWLVARVVATALLGLLAVVLSVALSIRVGRSLIRRLTGLRQAAQEVADQRLPSVVGRLRRGEAIDLAAAAPPLDFGTDEIGKVGNALSAVQRSAVESAMQEARLRHGLNDVFLNIARRSQALLHRQLSLLDRMERRATEPAELADLFQVDHLATRMRRHAEDLVILAGATPGRGWRNPVPIVDVIRGAVSEVEDYERVGFVAIPEASLAGRAVADVIHLLAEIIENATSYSPPHTRVQISGQLVPNGFAMEIEDRGLGMATEALDAANVRLQQPPDFDPANSAQLGLFVVALLGARHQIRVTLRASPYGGVTAVVLIPPGLVVSDEAAPGASSQGASYQGASYQGASYQGAGSVDTDRAAIDRPPPDAPRLMPVRRAAIGPAARHAADAPHLRAVPPPAAEPDLDDLTEDGLPRRHRQANLVAQLRVDSADPPDGSGEADGGRTPDEVRSMMSSFQAGLVRGRREAATLEHPGAEGGIG